MNGKCQVCEGAGWWHRDSGKIIWRDPAKQHSPDERLTKCMFCDGKGFVMKVTQVQGPYA